MLERIRHPRVVDFYGIAQVPMRTLLGGGRCVDEGRTRFFLVMEYLERGSIVDNVRRGQYCLKTSFMEHATQVSLSSVLVAIIVLVCFCLVFCFLPVLVLLACSRCSCVRPCHCRRLALGAALGSHSHSLRPLPPTIRALCSRLHSSPPRLRGSTSAALSIATSSLGTCS